MKKKKRDEKDLVIIKNKEYWFVLSCVIYPIEGIFKLNLIETKKVKLNPDIWSECHVPTCIKTLYDFLISKKDICLGWDWESHAPFDLESFYATAVCLREFGEDCIEVSE